MVTILVTIGAFGVLMAAMAIGVMAGRKPLQGSCGGTGGACACSSAEQALCALPTDAAMTPPDKRIRLDRLKA